MFPKKKQTIMWEKKRMKNVKKIMIIILMIVISFIIFMGTLYVLNGSLEMYPDAEKMEKARIAGSMIVLFGLITEFNLAKKL